MNNKKKRKKGFAVLKEEDNVRLTPVALVIVPLLVLSIVSVLLAAAVYLSGRISFLSLPNLLIAGITIYAATVFALGRIGISNVRALEKLSLTDGLCGLPNRRALHADIEHYRLPSDEVALALLDLDGFKQVNDHFSHFVGDQLIRECANILLDICGKEGRCYRLGGDEFAVTITGSHAGAILESLSRRIVERLARPIAIGERRITVGASIGLSSASAEDDLSSSELLRRADVAMYASKRGGKMRCTWFTKAFDRNREAIKELYDDLRHALANDEFTLAYQPLVDANNGSVVAVEALIRWPKPDGTDIGPNVFIPVAEETGLINPLGLWVLRTACTDALQWDELTLSVNLSAAQLRNPEFPFQLGEILEQTGFPAERLELEITETCLVLDPVLVERSLDVIRGFGVNIALDDFGTGYASIGFLRQFRFEKLKLDRSLVVAAGQDEGSRAMMLSSITVARALKMDVTAEGVETEEQAQLARTAGCDQIQGWLFYKAMSSAKIGALIETDKGADGAKRAVSGGG